MVILEQLRIHVGGLVRIKSDLFWYDSRGWDGTRGRICLLMDAGPSDTAAFIAAAARTTAPALATATLALLLVDGQPHWVWVGSDDLELL